jgi:WD40 repeat protein
MTLLFLSHSGADTEAARLLKARLQAAGIPVWFDKDDLEPGTDGWQRQLERAIVQEATAFAVYVGSRGIVNWVDAEVRLALSRAISGGGTFPFVPILAASSPGSRALPGFAQQFQSVRDVENDPVQWNLLLSALANGEPPPPETEPFFGLRAIDETRSHLFFGRKEETNKLVEIVAAQNLLLVSGDSGAGKSSLVLAGLVPAWRGNEVGLRLGLRPNDTDWHVVITRPRSNPRRLLAEAVEDAGKPLGLSAADLNTYAGLAESGTASEVRRALRCGLDSKRTRTLLVVDQFEELVSPATPVSVRENFAKLLADLADPDDPTVAVALTMRSDYTNLLRLSELRPLFDRLEANGRAARFLLGRITPKGLRDVVTEPLLLARRSRTEAEELASQVVQDVGDRPGDLALVQFALTEAWDRRGQHADDLPRTYAAVGRVEGALAGRANDIYALRLGGDANEAVVSSALIRLGSLAGNGITRRIARRAEFSDAGWEVIRTLASQEGNRLVLVSGEQGSETADAQRSETAEIAHEALLTQWDRLNTWLNAAPDDKRALDRLAERVASWEGHAPTRDQADGRGTALLQRLFGIQATQERGLVLHGPELARFARLQQEQPDWISAGESELILRSQDAATDDAVRSKRLQKILVGGISMLGAAVVIITLVAIGMSLFWLKSNREAAASKRNASAAFAALAEVKIASRDFEDAARLALSAFPRRPDEEVPDRQRWILSVAAGGLMAHKYVHTNFWEAQVRSVAFSPDGRQLATGSLDRFARVWNVATDDEPILLNGHDEGVSSVAFSPDGRYLVTGSFDDGARVWDLKTGVDVIRLVGHRGDVLSVAFSQDGKRIATGSSDETARVWDINWDLKVAAEVLVLKGHKGPVNSVVFSPVEQLIATASDDNTARLWNLCTGKEVSEFTGDQRQVFSVAFSPDGKRLATGTAKNTAWVWDLVNKTEVIRLDQHADAVYDVAFSPDGLHLATGSSDHTARVWNLATGLEAMRIVGHSSVIFGVAFAPNGQLLATGSGDSDARVTPIADAAGPDVARHLCSALPDQSDNRLKALEVEYGLTIDPICTKEQTQITVEPLFVPGPPIKAPDPEQCN